MSLSVSCVVGTTSDALVKRVLIVTWGTPTISEPGGIMLRSGNSGGSNGDWHEVDGGVVAEDAGHQGRLFAASNGNFLSTAMPTRTAVLVVEDNRGYFPDADAGARTGPP